jgi:hypothetical protein
VVTLDRVVTALTTRSKEVRGYTDGLLVLYDAKKPKDVNEQVLKTLHTRVCVCVSLCLMVIPTTSVSGSFL